MAKRLRRELGGSTATIKLAEVCIASCVAGSDITHVWPVQLAATGFNEVMTARSQNQGIATHSHGSTYIMRPMTKMKESWYSDLASDLPLSKLASSVW
jgi:hypothetical protein